MSIYGLLVKGTSFSSVSAMDWVCGWGKTNVVSSSPSKVPLYLCSPPYPAFSSNYQHGQPHVALHSTAHEETTAALISPPVSTIAESNPYNIVFVWLRVLLLLWWDPEWYTCTVSFNPHWSPRRLHYTIIVPVSQVKNLTNKKMALCHLAGVRRCLDLNRDHQIPEPEFQLITYFTFNSIRFGFCPHDFFFEEKRVFSTLLKYLQKTFLHPSFSGPF